MHEYEIEIADAHLDVLGHVNNAAYLSLFEQARWDLISRNGWGLAEIKRSGLGPVVLDAHLRFQNEVTGREKVRIVTKTLSYKSKLGRVEQVMYRADGKEACTAEFVFGLFDLKARKLVKPTPEWLRAVGLPA